MFGRKYLDIGEWDMLFKVPYKVFALMSSWIGYLINMKVSLVLNGKQLFYTATSKKIVATAH